MAAAESALAARVAVALPLLLVAIAAIWLGGLAFSLLVALGVCLILWEWGAMHNSPAGWRLPGLLLLLAITAQAHLGQPQHALALLAIVAALTLIAARLAKLPAGRRLTAGLLYAGLPAIALITLRSNPNGFHLVLWTMGIVWATDIFAYFAGRAIGGPKLWPALSPNKTWAGLIGGMAGAAIVAAIYGHFAAFPQRWPLLLLIGAGLAAVAQSGDLFESWLKRRAGVKDSGRILASHGGVMDRVDGLIPVAILVALWAALQPFATQALIP